MACTCSSPFSNLGSNPCKDLRKVARRFILVPQVDSTGAKNELPSLASVDKATLQAKFDNTTIADRWFPTPEFENVESAQADPKVQEFASGRKIEVSEGVRTMSVHFPLQGAQWFGKLRDYKCIKMAFYMVDADGNFIYSDCDGVVCPIKIEFGSMNVQYLEATEDEVSMVKLTFDVKKSEDEALQKVIPASDLDFDALDESDIYSLWDGVHVSSLTSDSGFTSKIDTDFGTKIGGLLQTDFTLFNVTTALAVTITGMTESPAGTYAFTFAPQTVTDVVRLTPVKARFDFSQIVDATVIL